MSTVLAPGRRAFTVAVSALATSVVCGLVLVASQTPAPAEAQPMADRAIVQPASSNLVPLGRGQMASAGSVSVLLYREPFSQKPWAYLRDSLNGTEAHVALPVAQVKLSEWQDASYAVSGQDLWILGGVGPIVIRHYQLSGGAVPTTATLVSSDTFGDTASRPDDLLILASGGVLGVWHQQSSPYGVNVVYRATNGTWSSVGPLQHVPTFASKHVAVQHPGDSSVWIFSSPDAYGAIGAAHLRESAGTMAVDWLDPMFVSVDRDGSLGPDPENPDLAVASDTATGEIVLAFQNRERTTFSTAPVTTGSHVTIARFPADGTRTYLSLDLFVERVSSLGLVVTPGQTWLAYRPIDAGSLTFDLLYLRRYHDGSWDEPTLLGKLASPYERVQYAIGRPEFATRLADGALHYFAQVAGVPTPPTTQVTTPPTTTAPTPKAAKCRGSGKGARC